MSELTDALYTRVKALVGAETVIWADQNSPRPQLPYWTVRVQGRRKIGRDDRSPGVDANGIQQIFGVREATVQLQRIGPDSDELMAFFRDQISKVSVRDAWFLSKVPVYDMGPVNNVPYQMDGGHLEPRSSLDLFIRYGAMLDDDVGVIETVEMGGQYETADATPQFDENIDLTHTITVVL
jgi:hypothetical protein